jgi:hypothetical protein
MLGPVDFAAIKAAIPISAAYHVLRCKPTKVCGRLWKGPCPVHGSTGYRSTSFRSRGLVWYCGRCQRGGDVIRLWALTHRLDDLHAALDLCAVMGIAVPRR